MPPPNTKAFYVAYCTRCGTVFPSTASGSLDFTKAARVSCACELAHRSAAPIEVAKYVLAPATIATKRKR